MECRGRLCTAATESDGVCRWPAKTWAERERRKERSCRATAAPSPLYCCCRCVTSAVVYVGIADGAPHAAACSRWKCKTATSLGIKWLNKIQLNPPSLAYNAPDRGTRRGAADTLGRDAAQRRRPSRVIATAVHFPSDETGRKTFSREYLFVIRLSVFLPMRDFSNLQFIGTDCACRRSPLLQS